MNKNKGITLIALVITIIVLLILAGVAISMLSGENGILKKAGEAKTKTEEAQKEEETTLIDYEIDSNFILKHSNFKCRYGMITGINVKGGVCKDTVESLQTVLPEGYTVVGEGITSDTKLKTGMEIQKDGKTVAWTVILGDVDGRIGVDIGDVSCINQILAGTKNIENDYIKVAADVDNDGEITMLDSKIINDINKNDINQYIYVKNPTKIVVYNDDELIKKYAKILQEKLNGTDYSIEWDSSFEGYLLKGATSETKVGTLLDLFENSNVSVLDDSNNQIRGRDEYIKNDDAIIYVYEKDERRIYVCWADIK